MSIFSTLKLLVLLRRIAIAQERLAACAEEYLSHQRAEWDRQRARKPRATEFASFDIDAANELYRREQEAAAVGATLEDQTRT